MSTTIEFKVGGGVSKQLPPADFLENFMVRLTSHQTSPKAKRQVLWLNRSAIAESGFQDAIFAEAKKYLGENEAREALGL